MFFNVVSNGNANSASYKNLTPKEVAVKIAKKEGIILLDVRTREEYNKGHLGGAINIPVDELHNRFSEIDKYIDKEIIVYCHSGKRSLMASEMLIKKGYPNITNMTGGIKEWIDSGGKVVTQ